MTFCVLCIDECRRHDGFPIPGFIGENLRHGQHRGSLRVLEDANRIHSVLRSLSAGMSVAFSSMQPSAGVKVPLAFCVPIKAKAVLGFHSPLCPPGLHRGEDKGIPHCPRLKAPSLWALEKFPTSVFWTLPSVFVCVYIYTVDNVCEPASSPTFISFLMP